MTSSRFRSLPMLLPNETTSLETSSRLKSLTASVSPIRSISVAKFRFNCLERAATSSSASDTAMSSSLASSDSKRGHSSRKKSSTSLAVASRILSVSVETSFSMPTLESKLDTRSAASVAANRFVEPRYPAFSARFARAFAPSAAASAAAFSASSAASTISRIEFVMPINFCWASVVSRLCQTSLK